MRRRVRTAWIVPLALAVALCTATRIAAADEEAAAARAKAALEAPPAEAGDTSSRETAGDSRTLLGLFLAGGPFMWPILALSLVVVAFSLERLLALRRGRMIPSGLIKGLEAALGERPVQPRSLRRLCREHPSVAADVVRTLLDNLGRPLPEVEAAVAATKDREASRLYANIRPISLAVTVSPLLGLLGTVQGMIVAFSTTAELAPGANRAAELAGGISMALVTTFAGLCVAVPAAVLAHALEGRILAGFRRIDELLDRFWPLVGWYERAARRSASGNGVPPAAKVPQVPRAAPQPPRRVES